MFQPNTTRHLRKKFRDEASKDMTFSVFNFLISSCWVTKCQPLTIDMSSIRWGGPRTVSWLPI